MPRKRRRNISNIKQKKTIATRLIQISLIMDDYIYKHKQVSVNEAESYIVEILSFKDNCADDPRSLQVIDKLTRFMYAIINEHQEMRGTLPIRSTTIEIPSIAVCVSPIDSLVDNDKDHLTQSIPEENNANLIEVNNFDEIDIREENNNIHYQEINNATENDSENKSIIDLVVLDSEDKETSKINNSQNISNSYQAIESQDLFNTYTQVENPIINLDCSNCTIQNEPNAENEYLKTFPEKSNNFTEIDYSQSILTNADNVEGQMNLQSQSDYTSDFTSVLDESKTVENDTMRNELTKKQVCLYTNEVYIKNSVKQHQEFNTKIISELELDNLNVPIKNIVKITPKTVANISEKIKNNKAPRKQKNNVKSLENVKTKVVKRKPRKKKDQVNTDIEKTSCDNKMNSSMRPEKTIDLSWVESLKYVREVSTAESHTRAENLSSSFWENYSLPNDWDDSEFDYKT